VKITRLLTLLALVLAALSVAAPAAAAKPCWVKLVNDWYDGRIDGTYTAKCYRDAIKNIPEDLKGYSAAEEDIRRALLAATRENGGELADTEPVEPQDDESANGPGSDDGDGGDSEAVPPGSNGGGGLLDFLKPSNADSVPIPLLVLAGLALVLLAAAGASFLARRVQARRVRVTPPPRGPQNP
jgi:hypothetical protein